MKKTTVIVVMAGLVSGSVAWADTISTRSRASLFQNQLSVLDGRATQQYSNSIRLQPPTVEVPGNPSTVTVRYAGRYNGPLLEVARAAARQHNIPEDLYLRLVQQESGWNTSALSNKGAIGLAQLMPGTASALGVDPHNVQQNLEGGARYLRRQYNAFGTWELALAAYNAGPGAVTQYGGIPPYRETQNYVRVIWGN